jgi:hypothetical protein
MTVSGGGSPGPINCMVVAESGAWDSASGLGAACVIARNNFGLALMRQALGLSLSQRLMPRKRTWPIHAHWIVRGVRKYS